MGQGAGKGLKVKTNKFKKQNAPTKVSQDSHKELKEDVCHFCKKKRHYQKDCQKSKVTSKEKVHLVLLYVLNPI